MRTIAIGFAILTVSAVAVLAGTGTHTVSGITGLSFGGRIDNLEGPGNIHFDWSGVEIDLTFTIASTGGSSGTVSLSVTDTNNLFNVFLDGATTPTTIIQTTPNNGQAASYVLASGLAPGSAHSMKITKRTEPLVGITIFHSISFSMQNEDGSDVVGSEMVVVASEECRMMHQKSLEVSGAPSTRRIEFYGDSITCGYGNEGVAPCNFTPQTENNYLAYGPVTARLLNATANIEAWSGKGVVRNYGSNSTTSPDPMPVYWNQSVANTPPSRWSFARYVPDVMVINLGTNDYSTQPWPSDQEYIQGYINLVIDILSAYPGPNPPTPAFVLMCGPMANNYCKQLQSVEAWFPDTIKVIVVDAYGVLTQPTDYGCDGHPSVAGHAKVAAYLAPYIQNLAGW